MTEEYVSYICAFARQTLSSNLVAANFKNIDSQVSMSNININ